MESGLALSEGSLSCSYPSDSDKEPWFNQLAELKLSRMMPLKDKWGFFGGER